MAYGNQNFPLASGDGADVADLVSSCDRGFLGSIQRHSVVVRKKAQTPLREGAANFMVGQTTFN